MKLRTILLVFLAALFLSPTLQAQTTITLDSTVLTEREVAIGLQVPWEILWGPDDHIWATERRGNVLRIDPVTGNTTTILNIQSTVSGGEGGLLGMALHPDFGTTPLVYLAYTYSGSGGTMERLVSYSWNGTALTGEVELLSGIEGGGIHNGSRLLFTPDGKLLMTTGDAGSSSLSQDTSSLNGKLLRINPDGSVPSDNPFPGSYIYTWGHRNQQGLTYGSGGQLYASEHGANSSDEFNLIEAGRNYGWPSVEGACNTASEISFCNANNVREPLTEWTPCVAVNDLFYYEHPAIPEWNEKMMMAVLGGFVQDPRLSILNLSGGGNIFLFEDEYFDNYGRIRDICMNPHNGALFFATNGSFYPGSGPNRIIEYRNLAYSPTSIAEPQLNRTQFMEVFPVPVAQNEPVHARFSANFVGKTYELISFAGEVVAAGKIRKEVEVPTKGLAAGNYYLKATNEKGTITQKIVIQ